MERSVGEIAASSLEWHSSGVKPTKGWSGSLSETISNLQKENSKLISKMKKTRINTKPRDKIHLGFKPLSKILQV